MALPPHPVGYQEQASVAQRPLEPLQKLLRYLSAAGNRGFLLDLFVLVLNLGVMSLLSRLFVDTIRRANTDQTAQNILFALAVALFVLAPAGATLKRWHHHKDSPSKEETDHMGGCFFNPIFYFCLTALIFATVNAFLLEKVVGKNDPRGDIFVTSVFLGLGLMIVHTVLVYRYFSPPKKPPRSAFLRGRASAFLGDVFLFANMVIFQLIWNLLTLLDVPRPTSVFDFCARLALLLFLALLLYFPPRMFYLADDIGKRRTWAMILLANLPVLTRVLIGSEQAVRW